MVLVTTGFFQVNKAGQQKVGNIGFKPKAIIFFMNSKLHHLYFANGDFHMMGFSTGAAQNYCVYKSSKDNVDTTAVFNLTVNNAIYMAATSGSVLYQADVVSMDSDGFTLNWITFNDGLTYPAYYGMAVYYMAIGGVIDAEIVNWTLPTTTGNKTVQLVSGMTPDCLIHAWSGASTVGTLATHAEFGMGVVDSSGNQWCRTTFQADNFGTSACKRGQRTDSSMLQVASDASISLRGVHSSFAAGSFTTNFVTVNSTAYQVITLALRGAEFKAGSFNSPLVSGSQVVTGLGLTPQGILFSSYGSTTSSTPKADARMSVGGCCDYSYTDGYSFQFGISSDDTDALGISSSYRQGITARCINIMDHPRSKYLNTDNQYEPATDLTGIYGFATQSPYNLFTFTRTTWGVAEIGYSAQITSTYSGTQTIGLQFNFTGYRVTVSAGQHYTWNLYAYAYGASDYSGSIYVSWYNSGGVFISQSTVAITLAVGFYNYSMQVTSPTGAASAVAGVELYNAPQNATLYWDLARFEAGWNNYVDADAYYNDATPTYNQFTLQWNVTTATAYEICYLAIGDSSTWWFKINGVGFDQIGERLLIDSDYSFSPPFKSNYIPLAGADDGLLTDEGLDGRDLALRTMFSKDSTTKVYYSVDDWNKITAPHNGLLKIQVKDRPDRYYIGRYSGKPSVTYNTNTDITIDHTFKAKPLSRARNLSYLIAPTGTYHAQYISSANSTFAIYNAGTAYAFPLWRFLATSSIDHLYLYNATTDETFYYDATVAPYYCLDLIGEVPLTNRGGWLTDFSIPVPLDSVSPMTTYMGYYYDATYYRPMNTWQSGPIPRLAPGWNKVSVTVTPNHNYYIAGWFHRKDY